MLILVSVSFVNQRHPELWRGREKHKPIREYGGRSPQRGPGTEPLWELGAKSPEAENILHIFIQKGAKG